MGSIELLPEVSVIIPVYNVAPYLREALDSVIKQTYSNLEILIIDDGSTDGAGQICDEYKEKDNRIRVIHQDNKGLSNARNTGLDLMAGEIIAFLDSDDAYHPNYITEMVSAMIREKTDIVMCKYSLHKTVNKMIQTGKEKIGPQAREGFFGKNEALCAMADGSIDPAVWNKIYKKKLWQNIRFPEGSVCEDVYTTYKILSLCNSVYVLDLPLYLYRIRPGSITNTNSLKNAYDKLAALSNFYSFVEENTPTVFTHEHIARAKKKQQDCIRDLIIVYLNHPKMTREEDISSEELRLIITNIGKEVGIESCTLLTKIVYWMLRVTPSALKTIYDIYSFMCIWPFSPDSPSHNWRTAGRLK